MYYLITWNDGRFLMLIEKFNKDKREAVIKEVIKTTSDKHFIGQNISTEYLVMR